MQLAGASKSKASNSQFVGLHRNAASLSEAKSMAADRPCQGDPDGLRFAPAFDRIQQDWGPGSKYAQIRSYKFALSRSWGNGAIIGVDINGGETPVFLWVDGKTKRIDFSPVDLYRPVCNKQ